MLEALVCAKDWLFKIKDPNTQGTTTSYFRNAAFFPISLRHGHNCLFVGEEDSENEAHEG